MSQIHGNINGILLALASMVMSTKSELELFSMKQMLEGYKKTYTVPEGADAEAFKKGTDVIMDSLIEKCDECLRAIAKGKE